MDPSTAIPNWLWITFAAIVVILLAVDLWSYRGHSGEKTTKKDLWWTVAWIAVSLAFGGVIWAVLGSTMAQEYFAAYAMEKALSLDNLFVFFVIFAGLRIATEDQHDVLFWGVLGAVVFRALFIFLGIEALERWEWVTYVFAAILLYGAWKAFTDDPAEMEESALVAWLAKRLPVQAGPSEGRFFVSTPKGKAATPLLLALVAIELVDVMFAVDSVPAALSITHNPFLVYSSNIFAILGLRALYLCVSVQMAKLRYLHYGLAGVLAFAAAKILLQDWVHVPPMLSTGIIVALIGAAIVASLYAPGRSSSDPAPKAG